MLSCFSVLWISCSLLSCALSWWLSWVTVSLSRHREINACDADWWEDGQLGKGALLVHPAQFSNLRQSPTFPWIRQCAPVSNPVNRCSASYRVSRGGEIWGQQLLFDEDGVQRDPLSQQRKVVKYWSRGTRLRFSVSLCCQCQGSVFILRCVHVMLTPSPGSMKLWCKMHVADGIEFWKACHLYHLSICRCLSRMRCTPQPFTWENVNQTLSFPCLELNMLPLC